MMSGDIKLALTTMRGSKWRNFLTMLGIIIGVTAVIVTISLGQGITTQVNNQLSEFGEDLIIIRPNQTINNNQTGLLGVNLFGNISSNLQNEDAEVVKKTDGVKISSPLSLVNATARYEDTEYKDGLVVGADASLPELINQEIEYGSFYSVGEEGRKVAVLGPFAAQELFGENVPVGKSFTLRGEEFIVRGIFEEFTPNPITPGGDFNNAIFIPNITSQSLSRGESQIFQIFAKPNEGVASSELAESINKRLFALHDEQSVFTILTQDQTVNESSYTLSLITALITGVAAISLFVGGIGVMNILLVSVSERTHEIGIRKAIGATRRQIMKQFMTEAIILSLVGSIIGVVLSLIINFLIRLSTDLEPTVDFVVAGLAIVVAILVGVIFGLAPAYRAARKNPIDALRHF